MGQYHMFNGWQSQTQIPYILVQQDWFLLRVSGLFYNTFQSLTFGSVKGESTSGVDGVANSQFCYNGFQLLAG